MLASILSSRMEGFPSPLLIRLDPALDRRLVKAFAAAISILLEQRCSAHSAAPGRLPRSSAAAYWVRGVRISGLSGTIPLVPLGGTSRAPEMGARSRFVRLAPRLAAAPPPTATGLLT